MCVCVCVCVREKNKLHWITTWSKQKGQLLKKRCITYLLHVINDFLTISTFSASQLFLGHIKSARVHVRVCVCVCGGGGGMVGHLRLPDNSVNFYSLEPGGVNLEARQPSLKNANTSFEWLMQSGELGAFVYSFILTWQSKEVQCMVLKVEGNFCGRPGLGVREFVCKCMQWRPDYNVGI